MRGGVSKDTMAGLFFITVSAIGLYVSSGYRLGTAFQMGPGYFPRLVFGALLVLGIAIAIMGLAKHAERMEPWAWRPLLALIGGLLVMGFAIQYAGLVAAIVFIVLVTRLAGARLTWPQLAALAAVLTALGSLVFVWALETPIPLLPGL
jgi:hypothetical protein